MDSHPLNFIVLMIAGWLHRHQAAQLAYGQRRRLAAKAKALGLDRGRARAVALIEYVPGSHRRL